MDNYKFTKGKWHWVEYSSNELPELQSEYNEKVCGFGNDYEYYPTEGEPPNEYDKLLISKAPEMLEMLVSVLELQKENYGNGTTTHLAMISKSKEIEKLIKEATEL